MDTDRLITAALTLRDAQNVVVFTGAGVSAESGIPTFRDDGGFWQRFPPESFATWDGLLKTALTRPRLLAEFILNVVEPVAKAVPNAGHIAIARLGERTPTTVVTQNVDGLHQAAGSQIVHEVHGSLLEVADAVSGEVVHRFDRKELLQISDALRTYVVGERSLFATALTLRRLFPIDWRGRHRPRLVLFGDALAEPDWTEACDAVDRCDAFVTVGTSGAVYPAALLPARAEAHGAFIISVDPQPGPGCWLEGTAADVLPRLVPARP